MQQFGKYIVQKYLDETSECEINVSYALKDELFNKLHQNSNYFTKDIFDECVQECLELIRGNVWNAFKREIVNMAGDADIEYGKPSLSN